MIMVAAALVVTFAFLILAIDLPMLLLAKSQLQNAADAGALAGALAYAQSSGDPAASTLAAIEVSGMNSAVQDVQQPVVITAGDVTFPGGNRVRVVTHRTIATGDPLSLHFMRIVNPLSNNLGEVTAVAAAEVFPISATDCVKPWMFPDRWEDDGDDIFEPRETFTDANGNGTWDPGEAYDDENRNGVWDPGEPYDPEVTGYSVPRDVGDSVSLKLNNPSETQFRTGWFYAVDFGPLNTGDPVHTGGDAYREWIGGCEPYAISVGDWLQVEPGNMVGPTNQGTQNLIDLDPMAQWDEATGTVINSAFIVSPRVLKAAVFDPNIGVQTDLSGRPYLTVVKILVFFLEDGSHGEAVGRFMRHATDGDPCPGCPEGFLYTTVLVE